MGPEGCSSRLQSVSHAYCGDWVFCLVLWAASLNSNCYCFHGSCTVLVHSASSLFRNNELRAGDLPYHVPAGFWTVHSDGLSSSLGLRNFAASSVRSRKSIATVDLPTQPYQP